MLLCYRLNAQDYARASTKVITSRSFKLTVLVAFAAIFAACSNAPDPADMLLTPEDFPNRQLQMERVSSANLEGEARSAEGVLLGEGYRIYHSVVILQDARSAAEMMESLGVDSESLGTKIGVAPAVGQKTLGIFKDRSTGNRSFILFQEGKVLVRVTLEGRESVDDLTLFAQRAWEKVR